MHRLHPVFRAILGAGAIVSIGFGCYLLHPAIAFIAVGVLVLADLRVPPAPRGAAIHRKDPPR